MKLIQNSSLVVVLMVFLLSSGIAQKNDNGAYINQEPPSTIPKIFAPGIISNEGRYEFGCTFSSDGSELFYGVSNGNIMEIHYTKLDNGKWSTHQQLFHGSPFSHNDPMYSPDEERLYFISNRPMNNGQESKDVDIWYIELDGDWDKPINIGSPINSKLDEYFVSFTEAGTMYFSSRTNAKNLPQNSFDIFSAIKTKSGFDIPDKLPSAINTNQYEADVFVAPNESYLIFCSTRNEGLGRGDLYISFKDEEGNWREAVNMGNKINSKSHELCPYVSKDGKYFFYTSNEDIYWVSTNIFDSYRKSR